MTDKPELTERQAQVVRALRAQMLAADIDPTEVGGLGIDELAQQLRVCEEDIRHDIEALIDLGFIEDGPAESAIEDDWFRQVECDWQWPDGRYCNMTVHFYAPAARRAAAPMSRRHWPATAPWSMPMPRHARRWARPSGCTGRSSRAGHVSVGIAPPIASASRRSTNSLTPIQTRSR
jgi:hypothetical protein